MSDNASTIESLASLVLAVEPSSTPDPTLIDNLFDMVRIPPPPPPPPHLLPTTTTNPSSLSLLRSTAVSTTLRKHSRRSASSSSSFLPSPSPPSWPSSTASNAWPRHRLPTWLPSQTLPWESSPFSSPTCRHLHPRHPHLRLQSLPRPLPRPTPTPTLHWLRSSRRFSSTT